MLAMVETTMAETWEEKGGVCHVLLNPGDKSVDLLDLQFILKTQIRSLNSSPLTGVIVIMKCII